MKGVIAVPESKRRIDSNALSLGELFRRPVTFAVPVYQRDFSWTQEEVDTLWDDLESAVTEDRAEYFLGAVTVSQEQQSKRCNVIDGQQRLAVLSMIFSAIARAWKQMGDETRYHGVFNDYLASQDRRTGDLLPKLRLNETNDGVYQARVLKGRSFTVAEKKTWPQSNLLLDGAYDRVALKVEQWTLRARDKQEALLDLEEYLSRRVNVILIQTSEESDAFVLFETLNDRGLELAVSDLVKNYLFSLAGTHIEEFKRAWAEATTLVGGENLTVFLRHCWLSEFALVREREMYRAIRSRISGVVGARQFVDSLRSKANLYAALSNPEHAY